MTQKAIEARIGSLITNEGLALFQWFTEELALRDVRIQAALRRIDELERVRDNNAKAADSRNMAEFRKQMKAYQRSEMEEA